MVSKVRFHPDAASELVAASDWYRQRSEIAARAFLIETDQAIKDLRKPPLRYPIFQNETQSFTIHQPAQTLRFDLSPSVPAWRGRQGELS